MTYKEIISRVSKETGLPIKIVDRVYMSYWKAIREHVENLPLKEELTDEEFIKLQPNINIPSIGKLNVTLERYRKMKEMFNLNKRRREEENAACNKDKASV